MFNNATKSGQRRQGQKSAGLSAALPGKFGWYDFARIAETYLHSLDVMYNLTNWLINTWPASSDIVMHSPGAWDRAGSQKRAVRLFC